MQDMKTRRRKRQPVHEEPTASAPTTIFSSDLLTPEEERELLADFWETKSELVRVLLRQFPRLRQQKPALEPWPMAQFIRDNCAEDARNAAAVRRLHDRYIHLKHRLASRTSAWPPTSPSGSATTPSATPTSSRRPSAG